MLREETGDPLHLLGHSFGGLVTRAAVLAEPGAVHLVHPARLGAVAARPAAGPSCSTTSGPLLDAGGVQLVHETLEQVAMTDPKAQAVPGADPRVLHPPVPAQLRGRAARHGRRDADRARPGAPSWPRPGVPVLVAHGEADDAWLPHVQADMAERLGARHEVINNSIHSPAVENPPRTLEVLLDFWAGASARS